MMPTMWIWYVMQSFARKSAQDPADDVPGMQVDESANIDLLCDNDMDLILERIYEQSPKAVILDSIQTVSLNGVSGSNGSVSQVPLSAPLISTPLSRKLHKSISTPLLHTLQTSH
jgi:predicted ATP-dependent serine protease